ncbi:uncharacterized protein LOC110415807 isoform X2 [Herrania umbratica]|uniref:Uncharacterized protein LOC110415807 isoform X2 n=1 Tax=Herrania umbratica TaxID=108875 RepID=A0A6J1A930_9ROSI|nr:uncharacterized protein LOC110415807 isoform X2 [Herrania umbratica]
MTRGIAKIHAKSGHVKQRKRADMKTLQSEMEIISEEQRGKAGKRSYGNQGRTSFPFSSRETSSLGENPRVARKKLRLQSRLLQVEVMEAEFPKLKVQMRNLAESLMAAREAADLTQSEFALLIRRRNGLMDNLIRRKNKFLKMKGIETLLMLKLGFL